MEAPRREAYNHVDMLRDYLNLQKDSNDGRPFNLTKWGGVVWDVGW